MTNAFHLKKTFGPGASKRPNMAQPPSCRQVQSEDIFATRELKDHDAPVHSVGCCPQVCPQGGGGEVVRATPLNTRGTPATGHVMAL